MDYFKKLIDAVNDDCIDYPEYIKHKFCRDVENYRLYSIKHHNNDIERATDRYCFNCFLNSYNIAINVYRLHSEKIGYKKLFNRLLGIGWQIYNTN